jgi:cobalt-zinc-cadmium efflux system outer membrane protein
VDEAKGRLTQSGLFPNPEIEISHTSDRPFKNEGEYAFSSGVAQKFPISGRLARARDVARVDVALAEAEIKNQERLLTAEVLKLYHQRVLVDEKLRFNSDLKKSLTELINVSEQRLKLAEVSTSDINLEKIELEKLIVEEARFQFERREKTIALNRLLGRRPESALVLAGGSPQDFSVGAMEKAIAEAPASRPDRALTVLQIDRAKSEERLARAERWEDWTLGLEYSNDKSIFSDPIGTKDDSFVGVRLSIPLPLWNQNEGKLAEAQARGSRARIELDSYDTRLRAEAETSRTKLLSLQSVLRRFETQSLKLARENVDTLRKSYADGLVGISGILQAQQQLAELQQSYVDTRTEFVDEIVNFQSITASFEAHQ